MCYPSPTLEVGEFRTKSVKLPVYRKYGISEIKEIDSDFGIILEKYLITDYLDMNKKDLWIELCNYIQEKLGNFDISNYEREEIIR